MKDDEYQELVELRKMKISYEKIINFERDKWEKYKSILPNYFTRKFENE